MPLFDNSGYSWDLGIDNLGNIGKNLSNGYQLGDLSLGLLGFTSKSSKSEDDKTKEQVADERAYSEDQINSARAWEEYMDSTKYQRAVKDLEAAGLNPWLALNSGVSGGSYHSVDPGNSAGSSSRSSSSSVNKTAVSAALIMALARLISKVI